MIDARAFVRLFFVGSLGCCVAACGDDGDDDGGGASALGTCNRNDTEFHCIERRGTAAAIADQEEGCDRVGGEWSNEPCPEEDLVGCCEYTFGDPFRECFYVGTDIADPEGYCTGTAGFEDPVWTPAS